MYKCIASQEVIHTQDTRVTSYTKIQTLSETAKLSAISFKSHRTAVSGENVSEESDFSRAGLTYFRSADHFYYLITSL